MHVRQCLVLLLVCSALGLGVTLALGVTYSDRLSSHATGFFAVEVDDAIAANAEPRRPRRSVLVVVDGLGHEAARTMGAIALLREHGQCRKTAVGVPSMSRPVYATISTGLEQDRTGARGNDDESPLFARSIWQQARAAGLSVAAVSELTWWQDLFPGAFTSYAVLGLEDDYFAALPPADLQLVHPLYVDEAGHEFGAASPEYAEAVARADRELGGLLRGLDFSQDLVVLTADHGHSLRGGHGGDQDAIANVMTCHAGFGVRRDPDYGHLRITTVAPSLALLLGLPFPNHMRAGDDDLDALWAIVDPSAFPAAYLEDRRAAVERFRRANEDAVRAWLPATGGSWDAFYDAYRQRHRSGARVLVAALALVCLLHLYLHRRRERQGEARSAALFGLGFVAVFGAVTYALQVGLRGSFDLSSVAGRGEFIGFTLTLGVGWTALAVLVHWLARRDACALMLDLAAILVIGSVLGAAHPLILGWRLGFPVPSPTVYFFPYFAALMIPAVAGVAVIVAAVVGLRPLRRRSDMIART
ncbi:alkaline phosphatase family protein [Nannocystis bainbridge]|uniref:Alkaline phosphatase family protein n=1 Tax=Nannocystis bainbridge TaxID=2995303 RepID=A0ABT5E653_9BACT|nr:alkaline phosphatase family protein [Nannocystis bainbridge]MDC0721334.1 alkaline phosphatase family protein [Nannocystis bainbridge]